MQSTNNLALIHQDQAMISIPVFGVAIVVPVPGKIEASGGGGKMKVCSKAVCVEGDETSVEIKGCMYTAPPYVIPGTGTAKLDKLADDQKAKETKVNGKAVLMKGSMFDMKFEVETPAQQPQLPTPDPNKSYSGGKGAFVPVNSKFFAK